MTYLEILLYQEQTMNDMLQIPWMYKQEDLNPFIDECLRLSHIIDDHIKRGMRQHRFRV